MDFCCASFLLSESVRENLREMVNVKMMFPGSSALLDENCSPVPRVIPPGRESASEVLLDHGGLQRNGTSHSAPNADSPLRTASERAGGHLHILTLEHEDGGSASLPVLDRDCEQRAEHAAARHRFHIHNVADVH